jgi:hypothetical protein
MTTCYDKRILNLLVNVSVSWTDNAQEYPSHLEFAEIPSEKEDSVIQGTVESDETCRVKRKLAKEYIIYSFGNFQRSILYTPWQKFSFFLSC